MAHPAIPAITPSPERDHLPLHFPPMGMSQFVSQASIHGPPAMLHHIVTSSVVGSNTPTPTSAATPVYSDSPQYMDFHSPASTSYLPTPPLVPSHSHPALLPGHSVGGPPSVHCPSLVPSAVRIDELSLSPRQTSDPSFSSRQASDTFPPPRRASDECRLQDTGLFTDPPRRGSEPLMTVAPNDGRIGIEDPCAERSYTELKVLGDGSFGTVWLCDWHSPVKPDVMLSAMQCGAGARPEWAGKRLVALKRMKRVFEGGWKQARDLGELQSLRRIPPHPAVIPLYDAFISPRSRELYFAFECMEGNLYQLTKSRKGRPLASGLIASCFHQIVGGLYHIHHHGYFHRDMKPENLLVTTTGLCDYLSATALNEINRRRAAGITDEVTLTPEHIQKDVQVIVKLADFGLARAINSEPPYTEYVSTRWYRAPEVLLRAPEYGAPVDMWAFGTILAEMVNLKPIFPGVSEIDQVYRICDTLGDPSDYGFDERGRTVGGGRWNTGVKLAKNVGFSFPKRKPVVFRSLFPKDTPESLVDCISGLLRYNPRHRLNSQHCMDHPYFHETLPHLQHVPPLPLIPFSQGQPRTIAAPAASRNPTPPQMVAQHREVQVPRPPPTVEIQTPEHIPVSQQPSQHQMMYGRPPMLRGDSGPYGASALVNQLRALDLPTDDLASYGQRDPSEEPTFESQPGAASPAYQESNHSSNHGTHGYTHPAMGSNPQLHNQHTRATNPHVAAYVQQQQQQAYELHTRRQVTQSTPALVSNVDHAPRLTSHSAMTLPSSAHVQHPMSHQLQHQSPGPSPVASPGPSKMAGLVSGKKKKWGLSAVFGGGDKHPDSPSLPVVDEQSYPPSSSGLKRTQSGQYADERLSSTTSLDPKLAKKLAEKEKRELQKAKREAAERAQQERARAVLQKRQQLETNLSGATDIEYHMDMNEGATGGRYVPLVQPGTPYGQMPSSSSLSLNQVPPEHQHSLHPYGHEAYEGGRNKSRKKAEDDDHSSIGRASSKSRSLLSVGTMDSDPGSRRHDPMIPSSRRTSSHATYGQGRVGRSASSLVNHSTASLESQLATQLARHATVASASDSSLSLGRRSGRAIASQLQSPHFDPQPSVMRSPEHAPTGPYGHSSGVQQARGSRRSNSKLPSIDDWPEHSHVHDEINPMFRVPQQRPQQHPSEQTPTADQQMTLPPFAAIARVADSRRGSNTHFQNH